MKHKYNIKLNPEPLSDDEIAQYKDFDALLSKHQETISVPEKTAKRRTLRYAIGAAAAMLVGAVLYFGFQSNTNQADQLAKAYFAKRPFIDPPLKDIQTDFSTKSISANQGGVFRYDNGSQVTVPAAAFVDNKGELVSGDVDIRYREFHDFVDFFLSGIPMHYDSLDNRYQLESAGMIEIYAEQDGERVHLHPDKSIDVELVSEINVANTNVKPSFNVYKLEVEQRNWVYKGADQISFAKNVAQEKQEDSNQIELNYQNKLKAINDQATKHLAKIESKIPMPAAPEKPRKNNGSDLSFDLDFLGNVGDNSEYAGKVWQLSPKNVDLDENALKVEWEDAKIDPINSLEYELTLISGSKNLKIIINPVLTGDEFDKAYAEYEKALAAYNAKVSDRANQLKADKDDLEKQVEAERNSAKKMYEENLSSFKNKSSKKSEQMLRRKIINRFTATSFGIWNCDRPLPLDATKVKANFIDNNKKELNKNKAYIVNKKDNTITKFLAANGSQVKYNKQTDNLMWVVTDHDKIAICKPEEFKRINQKKGDHTFQLELVEQVIKNEDDVRKILKF